MHPGPDPEHWAPGPGLQEALSPGPCTRALTPDPMPRARVRSCPGHRAPRSGPRAASGPKPRDRSEGRGLGARAPGTGPPPISYLGLRKSLQCTLDKLGFFNNVFICIGLVRVTRFTVFLSEVWRNRSRS